MKHIPRGDVGDVCTIDEKGGSSHSGSTGGIKVCHTKELQT